MALVHDWSEFFEVVGPAIRCLHGLLRLVNDWNSST